MHVEKLGSPLLFFLFFVDLCGGEDPRVYDEDHEYRKDASSQEQRRPQEGILADAIGHLEITGVVGDNERLVESKHRTTSGVQQSHMSFLE